MVQVHTPVTPNTADTLPKTAAALIRQADPPQGPQQCCGTRRGGGSPRSAEPPALPSSPTQPPQSYRQVSVSGVPGTLRHPPRLSSPSPSVAPSPWTPQHNNTQLRPQAAAQRWSNTPCSWPSLWIQRSEQGSWSHGCCLSRRNSLARMWEGGRVSAGTSGCHKWRHQSHF